MLITKRWEMFYTDSIESEMAVNQISIDVKNKRFILDIGAQGYVTEDYDECDARNDEVNLTDALYVSRLVFDLIVDGVKAKKFIELT